MLNDTLSRRSTPALHPVDPQVSEERSVWLAKFGCLHGGATAETDPRRRTLARFHNTVSTDRNQSARSGNCLGPGSRGPESQRFRFSLFLHMRIIRATGHTNTGALNNHSSRTAGRSSQLPPAALGEALPRSPRPVHTKGAGGQPTRVPWRPQAKPSPPRLPPRAR